MRMLETILLSTTPTADALPVPSSTLFLSGIYESMYHSSSLDVGCLCNNNCACPRQLIFLRKSDCLGCAELLCFVFFDLACFFLSSFSSLNNVMHKIIYIHRFSIIIIFVNLYFCKLLIQASFSAVLIGNRYVYVHVVHCYPATGSKRRMSVKWTTLWAWYWTPPSPVPSPRRKCCCVHV